MKKTREEILTEINEAEISDEVKISLMEDISDSFEEVASDGVNYKEMYEELLVKYKDRFLEPVKKAKTEETEETEEDKIVDIKEI